MTTPQVLCNNRGQGTIRMWGAPISQAVLPVVDMYDFICLPQAQGSSTPQPTQGYRSAGLSRCLIFSTGPLHHPPLPQLLGVRDLAPKVLICSFSLRVRQLLGTTQHPPQGGLLPMPTSTFLNPCTLLPACPLPLVKVTHTSSPTMARVHIPILIVPPGILRGTSKVSTLPHPLLIWEGRGEGLEWPRYTLGPRTQYPRVGHQPVVIMGPRHPLPPRLLVPTATPAPGRVTGSHALRTCAMMGSRAGKPSCTSS